jgi:hypothetical protein
LGQMREFEVCQTTCEQLASAYRHGGGWLISAWVHQRRLEARLFQLAGKVAGTRKERRQKVVPNGLGRAGKVLPIGARACGHDSVVQAVSLPPLWGPSIRRYELGNVPVAGLEPSTGASFIQEIEFSGAADTTPTQTTAKSECAAERDHYPRRDMVAGEQSVGRGAGGGRVGSNEIIPIGRVERGICVKAGQFEQV